MLAKRLECGVFSAAFGEVRYPVPDIALSLVGSIKLEPFGVLQSLAEGKLNGDSWRQQCIDLGIDGVDLSTVGPEKPVT